MSMNVCICVCFYTVDTQMSTVISWSFLLHIVWIGIQMRSVQIGWYISQVPVDLWTLLPLCFFLEIFCLKRSSCLSCAVSYIWGMLLILSTGCHLTYSSVPCAFCDGHFNLENRLDSDSVLLFCLGKTVSEVVACTSPLPCLLWFISQKSHCPDSFIKAYRMVVY